MRRPLLQLMASLAAGATLALGMAQSAAAQIALVQDGVPFQVKVTTFRDIPFRTVVRQQYDYSCGSAALATILRYHYGREVTEAEVFKAMWEVGDQEKIKQIGFSLLDMKRYLEANGLKADGYRATVRQLENAKAPAIAVVSIRDYKHFVVIKGVRNGMVLLGDPAQGLKVYSEEEFLKMWNGVIFVIHNQPGQMVAYNRTEEWQPWPQADLDRPVGLASLSGFTRELHPLYQVSGFFDLDPSIAGDR